MKTLIIYTTNKLSYNLEYFCKFAYFYDKNIDFYICLNNNNLNIYHLFKSIDDNLFIINKDNIGYDFGAWSYILLNNNLYKNYDYFILLNDTCIGPFLPVYIKDNWVSIFISQINNYDKLIGATINYNYMKPHVQSYFLCFDKIIINLCINNNIFSNDLNNINILNEHDKKIFINNYEIRLSTLVLDSGYNIKCMMKGLENIDFRLNREKPKIFLEYGEINKEDMLYENQYFNISINPFEVIFFKSNRNINNKLLEKYIQFNNRIINNSKDKIY